MHTAHWLVFTFAILGGPLLGSALAQEVQKTAPSPDGSAGQGRDAKELEAIHHGSTAFVEAFNRADPKAVAILWAPDGDYIDGAGHRFAGREAIQAEYEKFFQHNPGSQIRIVIDSLRLINKDAAIEDGRAIFYPASGAAPSVSQYTAVHAKVDGQWLMSSVRDAPLEQPAARGQMADLEWLIGTWRAEQHGVKSESVCRWIADKSFVERTYTTTHPDGTVSSGVQIIGWDPVNGRVQSWNFTSDGGYALGIWTPLNNGGWSAEIQGIMGDGTPTTAVNILRPLDDNAYAWQSVQRTAGGQVLADTGEVVIRRSKASERDPQQPQNKSQAAETRP